MGGGPLSSVPIESKRGFSMQARKMSEDSSLKTFTKRALNRCELVNLNWILASAVGTSRNNPFSKFEFVLLRLSLFRHGWDF